MAMGCAFVPQRHAALEQAWREFDAAKADERVRRLAGGELDRAQETLERASRARDTLQDPALIDHLTYMARRQVTLSIEVANWRDFEPRSEP
jgi:hypothetical protein